MFQQILLRPREYEVLGLPSNLNGDYLSDAMAAQVGGLGMAPGANIGDHAAVFEATHRQCAEVCRHGQNESGIGHFVRSDDVRTFGAGAKPES